MTFLLGLFFGANSESCDGVMMHATIVGGQISAHYLIIESYTLYHEIEKICLIGQNKTRPCSLKNTERIYIYIRKRNKNACKIMNRVINTI